MTDFTGPLNVRALDQETHHATIDASGTATFGGNLGVVGTSTFTGAITVSAGATIGGVTIINAVVTANVSVDNTGAQPVPTSAATFMELSVNGTTYMVALFTKAT